MGRRITTHGVGLILSIGTLACTPSDDFESNIGHDDLEFRRSDSPIDAKIYRPGSGGLWIGNGLHDPSVGGIDPGFGLSTPEGLSEALGMLVDSDHWTTAEYLVECALSEEQSITKVVDGEPMVFDGLVGLAPQWEHEACDEDCQQWVTACLLARTNTTGQVIMLSMRSSHPAVGAEQDPSFPVYEASWYGNLFANTPELYFCRGNSAGLMSADQEGRTCSTGHHEDCGFTDLGGCHDKQRCSFGDGTASDCSAGDQQYNTISTFLDPPGQ